MLQIARFTVFTVSGLLRENQGRGRIEISLPLSRLVLKCQEIRNRAEVGYAIPNVSRCLLNIYVESVLKAFKHFDSFGVWSSGAGFWCFRALLG